MTRIAILGLNDASLRLAASLHAAGEEVIGFDPAPPQYSPVTLAPTANDAVQGAKIVLAFTTPATATSTAETVANVLDADAIYADFSAGTPEAKERLAGVVSAKNFVDAALVSEGAIEVSGAGAALLAHTLGHDVLTLTTVSALPGDVAKRMLIRSLLAKSLASAITDTLWAAESLGLENWAWEEVQTLLAPEVAQDLIDDTATNFKRHQIEMQDVVELLSSSGYDSTMIAPTQFTHGRIMHGKKIPHSQSPRKQWIR